MQFHNTKLPNFKTPCRGSHSTIVSKNFINSISWKNLFSSKVVETIGQKICCLMIKSYSMDPQRSFRDRLIISGMPVEM